MRRQEYKVKPKQGCYYLTTMLARQTDADWRETFRVSIAIFQELERVLAPSLAPTGSNFNSGRSVGQQLATCLVFLARGSYYSDVAGTMNTSDTTVCRNVLDVCAGICSLLGHKLAIPRTQQEMQLAAAAFYARTAGRFDTQHGLLHVIGAIDGTHIPIRNPKKSDPKYINRKKGKSVNVQAVCDARGRFIYVFTGMPGRTHDSKAFKRSTLYASLTALAGAEDPDLGTDMWDWGVTVDGTHVPFCLVADSAYACEAFVVPAWKDTQARGDRQRKHFNRKHSSTRSVIEGAFGRLKMRFRVTLRPMELVDKAKINDVITACCILHNMCEDAREPLPPVDAQLMDDLREHAEAMRYRGDRLRANLQPPPGAQPGELGMPVDAGSIRAYMQLCRQLGRAARPELPDNAERQRAGTRARDAVLNLITADL
jgi:hypothetical protein